MKRLLEPWCAREGLLRARGVLQVGWAEGRGQKAAPVKVGTQNGALNHLALLTAQMASEANTSPLMQLYLSFGKVNPSLCSQRSQRQQEC